jgi:hypothetical protein
VEFGGGGDGFGFCALPVVVVVAAFGFVPAPLSGAPDCGRVDPGATSAGAVDGLVISGIAPLGAPNPDELAGLDMSEPGDVVMLAGELVVCGMELSFDCCFLQAAGPIKSARQARRYKALRIVTAPFYFLPNLSKSCVFETPLYIG